MEKRAATSAFLCACLFGVVAPLNGAQPLTVRVSPVVTPEPATLSVVAVVEADNRNRSLEIIAKSDNFLRSSQVDLDGQSAERIWNFEFRDLPHGHYEVTGILSGSEGRRTAVMRAVMVVPRFAR